VALWRDTEPADDLKAIANCILVGQYPGYARAVNALVKVVMKDPECHWIVSGGDDVEPDPNHSPEEIAQQCTEYFGGTFAVMQPTGDRWAGGHIDRIAGSPWIGREWCERSFGGNGPFWHEFYHMHVDEHLMCCAEKLGVYWRRRDLVHRHEHITRDGEGVNWIKARVEMPEFLRFAHSPQHWEESKALFHRLKAGGFSEADVLFGRVKF
jgi:hypothetical protein